MLVAALVLSATGSDGAFAAAHRARISVQLPGVVRVGESIAISGRAVASPAGSKAELQLQIAVGHWSTVASTRLRAGAFVLRWQPQPAQQGLPIGVRVVIVHRGVVLAGTRSQQMLVGPAPQYCAPPLIPQSLPPGDGVIVGGLYTLGGPAPGIDACREAPYTITLTSASGAVASTQLVPAGQSYALVAPAGSYTLSDEGCSGPAVVIAGRVTEANTDCDVP